MINDKKNKEQERPLGTSYIRILAYKLKINIDKFFEGINKRVDIMTQK